MMYSLATVADYRISLPDGLDKWVASRVAEGHATVSDYLTSLIRADIDRDPEVARLRDMIEAGRASGISDRSLADILKEHVPAPGAI